mmetsp:Transcript_48410/g.73689  ORF Transcript_48410/g.73689 Transcript_48410/m.73689 type:complete len:85 (+) Transcript_48410:436-690(+)
MSEMSLSSAKGFTKSSSPIPKSSPVLTSDRARLCILGNPFSIVAAAAVDLDLPNGVNGGSDGNARLGTGASGGVSAKPSTRGWF